MSRHFTQSDTQPSQADRQSDTQPITNDNASRNQMFATSFPATFDFASEFNVWSETCRSGGGKYRSVGDNPSYQLAQHIATLFGETLPSSADSQLPSWKVFATQLLLLPVLGLYIAQLDSNIILITSVAIALLFAVSLFLALLRFPIASVRCSAFGVLFLCHWSVLALARQSNFLGLMLFWPLVQLFFVESRRKLLQIAALSYSLLLAELVVTMPSVSFASRYMAALEPLFLAASALLLFSSSPKSDQSRTHAPRLPIDAMQQHQILEAILQSSGDALAVFNATSDVLCSSTKFQQLVGSASHPGALISDSVNAATTDGQEAPIFPSPLDLLEPESHRQVQRAITSMFEAGSDYNTADLDLCKVKSEEALPLHVRSTLLPPLKAGSSGLMLAMFDDLAPKNRLESALLEAHRSKHANESKSRFLANMSHEIRVWLSGILGMIHLLEGTQLTEEQHEFLGTIKMSAQILLTVINDILDFSKIEAGQLTIERVEFDIFNTIEMVVELLYPSAGNKNLLLQCFIDPRIPTKVLGDPSRLQQILVNLLSNAIKFTKKGRVFLKCTLENETLENATVLFEVHDTGIGLTPDTLARLFRRFSQEDASTTRKFGGTGLGLVISKSLVELMGGSIGADSVSGKGSRFWFRLPVGVVAEQADTDDSNADVNAGFFRQTSPLDDASSHSKSSDSTSGTMSLPHSLHSSQGDLIASVEAEQPESSLNESGTLPQVPAAPMLAPASTPPRSRSASRSRCAISPIPGRTPPRVIVVSSAEYIRDILVRYLDAWHLDHAECSTLGECDKLIRSCLQQQDTGPSNAFVSADFAPSARQTLIGSDNATGVLSSRERSLLAETMNEHDKYFDLVDASVEHHFVKQPSRQSDASHPHAPPSRPAPGPAADPGASHGHIIVILDCRVGMSTLVQTLGERYVRLRKTSKSEQEATLKSDSEASMPLTSGSDVSLDTAVAKPIRPSHSSTSSLSDEAEGGDQDHVPSIERSPGHSQNRYDDLLEPHDDSLWAFLAHPNVFPLFLFSSEHPVPPLPLYSSNHRSLVGPLRQSSIFNAINGFAMQDCALCAPRPSHSNSAPLDASASLSSLDPDSRALRKVYRCGSMLNSGLAHVSAPTSTAAVKAAPFPSSPHSPLAVPASVVPSFISAAADASNATTLTTSAQLEQRKHDRRHRRHPKRDEHAEAIAESRDSSKLLADETTPGSLETPPSSADLGVHEHRRRHSVNDNFARSESAAGDAQEATRVDADVGSAPPAPLPSPPAVHLGPTASFTPTDVATDLGSPRSIAGSMGSAPIANKTKILLVEDNYVNQKVMSTILAKAGFHVDVANHGKEALAMLTKSREHLLRHSSDSASALPAKWTDYAVVLMDCQMPIMGGYEATQHIRAMEQSLIATSAGTPLLRLPVIAMTAEAMEDNRATCLASGMSDYMSKPVSQATLWRKLQFWISSTEAIVNEAAPSVSSLSVPQQNIHHFDASASSRPSSPSHIARPSSPSHRPRQQ
ncbi:response regulator receiver [Capsaspora owczarzaki ATCC 30864]|nr:response regulator receiver [Capsaspora owczarzaki ATCC 30864]KJE89951.1 response regulator receiver, variant 1 [Capsaspora owczarzaki ATCC 30864]KJE89952.1 response regulator receiver, variant 2 [Capsaspora owczarzaki ATCC 30864]|eukprot:XP_004349868.1 response regulator receiver [Capsaspora owczarzaki ATCC 30864]